MITMRRFSLWLFAVILMSGISLSVQAQLSKGHFFLSFEDKLPTSDATCRPTTDTTTCRADPSVSPVRVSIFTKEKN